MFCVALASGKAIAGLSAENVIVVVNGGSYNSRTLANQYVRLRNIPSSNVIVLDGIPANLKISLDGFRNSILKPVLKQIQSRGLAGQARVIAYSADFPTTVDIEPHTKKLTDPTLKKLQKSRASINGATYFYQFILRDNHQYLNLASNTYCRGPFNRHFAVPFSKPEQRSDFFKAERLFDSEEYIDASEIYERLFLAAPNVAPLALRAAEARMKSGDADAAKSWIVKAVAAGWTSKKWFADNPTLAPLIDQPPISSLAGRLTDHPTDMQEPIGFSSQVAWSANGYPTRDRSNGIVYMMSCMLGVVHHNGSDINQATEVLRRAAGSDFTNPKGEFWFAVSKDVRTKTRLLQQEPAKNWLKYLGHKSESPFNKSPKQKGTLSGLMLGTPKITIGKRKWNFVPGALADNLTSQGAYYGNTKQSKLNVLLHAGAAMSSGTVTEPYAIAAKFPLPMMYAYYATGTTAIEAFYLSIASPYQLLIVGDPLAQPFAKPPLDKIEMERRANVDSGITIDLTRQAITTGKKNAQVGGVELYLNGRLAKRLPALEKMSINLADKLVGANEIRAILIGNSLLQVRKSTVRWVDRAEPKFPTVTWDGASSTATLQCDPADSIELLHHQEVIGSVSGSRGEIKIDAKKYGGGPLRIRPVAILGEQRIAGRPKYVELPMKVEPFTKPKS